MYSVSVIMPVYNNEKTLERAVESILNQSMYGFELILVNDGSTDRSAQICDEYAKKEPLLVEVIHQKRLGLGIARNKGLYKSSGEYIYFADATDIFDNKLLQANINLAKEKKSELVVFGFSAPEDNNVEIESHLPRMPLISEKDDFRNHYRNFHHFYPYALYNKIYKRDYLFKNRIHFSNIPKREDAFFNLNVYRNLKSVAFNRGVYCHKLENESLLSAKYDPNLYEIQLQLARNLEMLMLDWDYTNVYTDLIAEEYFKAAYIELNNVCSKESPFSFNQQVERMEQVLQEGNIQDKLQSIPLTSASSAYRNKMITHFKNKDAKKAIELTTRRKEVRQATSTMKKMFRKIFSK